MSRMPGQNSKLCGGQLHQLAHARRFRLRYLPAIGRDPIVTTTLVVKVRVGPVSGFFDQPQLQHFVDRSVQHARAQLQFALGAGGDFALDGIAVAFTPAEGKKDMEDGG